MAEGAEDFERTDRSGDSGTRVLEWLSTEEAAHYARGRLARSGFGGEVLIQDVLSDAQLEVLKRMRSSKPLELDNPVAYGTKVIASVISRLVRGDVIYRDDLDYHVDPEEPAIDSEWVDEVRLALEHTAAPDWLTSAALACVCFILFPDSLPADAPSPKAGARPDQARVWPALWFAGRRDLFPNDGADPRKRARARHIEKVQSHLESVFVQVRSHMERSDV